MKGSFQPKTTRDAILDATDRLLALRGYKKMTIDELAAEVGIGKGSVYLHFTSKEEIALSHIDRIIERLKKNLAEIAAKKLPVERRLKLMLLERVLYRFDSVQHYSHGLNEMLAHIRQSLLERRKRYFEEEARIFANTIDEGAQAEIFSNGNSLETARTLLTATNSLLPYSLSTQELGERKEIEKKASKLADLLIKGLREKS